MANTSDIATVLASALAEAGVTGKVDVTMGGDHAVAAVGDAAGDDVAVVVVVKPLG